LWDINRTAKISLIFYFNGVVAYNLLQKGVKINDIIYAGTLLNEKIEKLVNGFSLPLRNIPLFSIVSNIEIKPFKGGKLVRSAGTSAVLIGKDLKYGFLKLKSGWTYNVSLNCMSSIGAISKRNYVNEIIGKAGKNRGLGWRPRVRGVACNPCDHPHGGGNGKKSKLMVPTNAWSTIFKWKHTKNKLADKLNRRKYKKL